LDTNNGGTNQRKDKPSYPFVRLTAQPGTLSADKKTWETDITVYAEQDGKALANQQIVVSYKGNELETITTSNKGIASITVRDTIDTIEKTFKLNFTLVGKAGFEKSISYIVPGMVASVPKPKNPTKFDVDAYVKDDGTPVIFVRVLDDEDLVIPDIEVNFKCEGARVHKKTDETGYVDYTHEARKLTGEHDTIDFAIDVTGIEGVYRLNLDGVEIKPVKSNESKPVDVAVKKPRISNNIKAVLFVLLTIMLWTGFVALFNHIGLGTWPWDKTELSSAEQRYNKTVESVYPDRVIPAPAPSSHWKKVVFIGLFIVLTVWSLIVLIYCLLVAPSDEAKKVGLYLLKTLKKFMRRRAGHGSVKDSLTDRIEHWFAVKEGSFGGTHKKPDVAGSSTETTQEKSASGVKTSWGNFLLIEILTELGVDLLIRGIRPKY
jgi:hypothetical protein